MTDVPSTIEPTKIKALVVRAPWFEDIFVGEKAIEYRSWNTHYRGPMLIVAAKRKDSGDLAGCAICVVDLINSRKIAERDFEWDILNVRPICPVALHGRLGLFDVKRPIRLRRRKSGGRVRY